MKTKKTLSLLTLLIVTCLFLSGCPKPKSRTIIVECNNRGVCTGRVIIVYFGPTSQISNQIYSGTSGIFDVANPWQPDVNRNSSAIVKVTRANGQATQSNFATQLSSTTGNVLPVDKNTTPYLYIFQNPNDVNNFVSESLVGEANADIEIEFVVPLIQVDCGIPSGKYVNHLRYSDSSGVSYVDSFTLNYSVPDNVQGANACEQATITVE